MTAPALEATQGRTVTLSVSGITADLTGWSPRLTLRSAATWQLASDAPALSLTVGSGLVLTPGAYPGTGSRVDATITAAQSASLLGVYVWDLQVASDGTVRPVDLASGQGEYVGSITFSPAISRTAP